MKDLSIVEPGQAEDLETKHVEAVSPRKLVENTVRSKHPASVRDLAQMVMTERTFPEDDFITVVKEMARDGSIVLKEPEYEVESPFDYLFTPALSMWLWTTVGVTALALVAVFLIPDSLPIVVFRWVLGSILVLFLPGYALLQVLFPKGSEIDSLERFALNIGLSLALVPLIGLILNYTPWGIRLVPIVTSLSAFTITFAIAAAIRKYFDVLKPSSSRQIVA